MRGVYWALMPDFAEMNALGHEAGLPGFYWSGETRVRCLAHAIGQSLTSAYAHHIQRLMVTGNFALLAGVHPDAVDAWYRVWDRLDDEERKHTLRQGDACLRRIDDL